MVRETLHAVRACAGRGFLLAGWALLFGSLSCPDVKAAGKATFSDLLADLKSPTVKTRLDAVAELAKSRRREAVEPLSAVVRDPDARVRMAAVRALGDLRDLSATPALLTSLTDGDPKIRDEAVGTLVELYAERERSGPIDGFLQLFSDEYDRASVSPFTAVDPAVFKGLAALLRDEERVIRQDVAYSLGILGATPEVPALVAALQDADPGVRGAAATSLGKLGTAQDGKALIPLLSDASNEVRNRAMQAIGVLRVREAGPPLRELFDLNRKRALGVKVLASLSRIADPSQSELFRELLADPDPEKRRLAIEGLGRVADPSQLAAFKKDYQRERAEELRLAYSFAITMLGDKAFVDTLVLALPSGALGTRARNYILELGPPLVPELLAYLSDPEAEIRAALCDILSQIGDGEAIRHLDPLISDPSTKVADRANRAVELLRRGRAGSSPR
ncbi:MAG TPA: HEAT repeat domain-containing protein [Vicinamibacteria bacterium]